MKKFLEIQKGLLINVEEIEAIEDIPDGMTRVYTHHRSYESDIPLISFESILNLKFKEEDNPAEHQFVSL